MSKILYIVRHCKATGQEPEAPLTPEGLAQAEILADTLIEAHIERIVSSPFVRAVQSIQPLAQRLGLDIETDSRLTERILSTGNLADWRECLRATFADPDLCFPGGESSRTAAARAVAVVQDILTSERSQITALVSHGNLSTLLLKHFDERMGFETWEKMSNPDVFRVAISDTGTHVERFWK